MSETTTDTPLPANGAAEDAGELSGLELRKASLTAMGFAVVPSGSEEEGERWTIKVPDLPDSWEGWEPAEGWYYGTEEEAWEALPETEHYHGCLELMWWWLESVGCSWKVWRVVIPWRSRKPVYEASGVGGIYPDHYDISRTDDNNPVTAVARLVVAVSRVPKGEDNA